MPRRRKNFQVNLKTPQGEQRWKVRLDKLPQNQHQRNYGLCSFTRKTITIDDRFGLEYALKTAIHEAAHAALGPDYAEPAIERIEHNAFEVLMLLLRDKLNTEI